MSDLAKTIETLGHLVAFPTVSSDSNLELINWAADRLNEAGARVEVMPALEEGKANLYATIGPEVSGGIVLSGHTDVVPVEGQPWTSDPFAMEERDGLLFGRGTADMKGFVAACIAVAPWFAAQPLARPVHFAFTYDEETGCLGGREMARALAERDPRPAIVIVGEPTNMAIIEGHKGCHEYLTRFTGLAGHGSNPGLGVNAVEYAGRDVGKLLEIRDGLAARPIPGSRYVPPYSTVNVGVLHGGVAPNVIPDHAEVEWDTRPVRAEDLAYVKDAITRFAEDILLPEMRSVSPDAGIELEVIGEVEGLEPMEENAARDLVTELTGVNSTDVVAFGTEAGLFQAIGMSVVVCGPGSIEQAHKADEFIAISELDACLGMLKKLGRKLSA